MLSRTKYALGLALCVSLIMPHTSVVLADANDRETPLVRAVANCRSAVVNLRGRKTVRDNESPLSSDVKQVNGMGTGVIIDSRGYVLTNYHVVEDVKEIQVTTSQREKTIGQLIAHDPETDLALLKIDLPRELPTIPLGTSSDLMLAETVAAVGNAYGYEHTVTVGIISQLGRTVQVNDDQVYRNLIQTDAPINPGNSGGPLLNLDGHMIGINVAVRIGAQGIAFAIPANDAMEIAADLMAQHASESSGLTHGIKVKTEYENNKPFLLIKHVDPKSSAAKAGIKKGDRITQINGKTASRSIDLHAAMIGTSGDQKLKIGIDQDGSPDERSLDLAKNVVSTTNETAWKMLGINVKPATAAEMANRHPNYTRGLKVTQVKKNSPADMEGIAAGDILVAMHGWKTESMDNLQYILEQPDILSRKNFMFYILREKEPFWGKLRIASQPR